MNYKVRLWCAVSATRTVGYIKLRKIPQILAQFLEKLFIKTNTGSYIKIVQNPVQPIIQWTTCVILFGKVGVGDYKNNTLNRRRP
jgi:hypothetical protein